MKLLAFAASNARNSINKQLVTHAADLMKSEAKSGLDVEILDLNDFLMPIYSIDIENESGVPDLAQAFLNKIASADALLISYAEHNGGYAVAYKNIFDWASRLTKKVFQDKPMLALSTSPGAGGGASVLATAKASAGFFGADIVDAFSVPAFFENFDAEAGTLHEGEVAQKLQSALAALQNRIAA